MAEIDTITTNTDIGADEIYPLSRFKWRARAVRNSRSRFAPLIGAAVGSLWGPIGSIVGESIAAASQSAYSAFVRGDVDLNKTLAREVRDTRLAGEAEAAGDIALGKRLTTLGERSGASHAAFMHASNVLEGLAQSSLQRFNDTQESNSQTRFAAYKEYEEEESQALRARFDDIENVVPPSQKIATARAKGAAGRFRLGYALPGERQAADVDLRRSYSVELETVRDSEEQTRAQYATNPKLRDALLLPQIEQEQELMTEMAQSSYQLDRSFGQNLQTLTVGGSSRTVRDMPSYAQAAAMIEKDFPTVAARNFGFTNAASGHAAVAGSDGYLAGGSSPEAAQPGNQTIQALAQVLSAATLKFDVNINGQRYTGPLKVITQQNTNQSGFGTLVPGVSH